MSRRNVWAVTAWLVALVVAVAALGSGAMHINPATAVRLLMDGRQQTPESVVMWDTRLPRLLLGFAVGVALPTATVLMQLILANPIAEPALLGLGSASALGTALAIVMGAGFATAGAFTAAFVVTVLAFLGLLIGDHTQMRSRPERMILQGVAVGSLLGGLTGVITSALPDPQLRSVAVWTMGTLSISTLGPAVGAAAVALVGLAVVIASGSRLDPLLLGSTYALSRGVNGRRLRSLAMFAAAGLVAAGTAACGVIPFVGLASATFARRIVGVTTARLAVTSAALGVSLVLASDALARTVYAPMELPIGLVTSVIGAPVMFLAMRGRS